MCRRRTPHQDPPNRQPRIACSIYVLGLLSDHHFEADARATCIANPCAVDPGVNMAKPKALLLGKIDQYVPCNRQVSMSCVSALIQKQCHRVLE